MKFISGRKNVSKNVSKSGCKTDPWNCGVIPLPIGSFMFLITSRALPDSPGSAAVFGGSIVKTNKSNLCHVCLELTCMGVCLVLQH